jgi:phenylacetate-coenzyme A ligase PaaK-like adenylate-forming protein
MYVVVKPDGSDAPLQIRVERGETDLDDATVGEHVANAVREELGLESAVQVLDRDTLERSGYKTTRVIDE